jgi:short-subunit dehydrogenase
LILQASKAAVSQFFETLRVELGNSVPITLFLPGTIKSEVGSFTAPS